MLKILKIIIYKVIALTLSIFIVASVFSLLQTPVTDKIILAAVLIMAIFVVVDSIITLRLLGEPMYLPLMKNVVHKVTVWLSTIMGFTKIYELSSSASFSRLHRTLGEYDRKALRAIREDITVNKITYLQPLDQSWKQWGSLFSLWNNKLRHDLTPSGIRWALLSDLYLTQESKDLKESKFATDLDLYAKAILSNLYLSVKNEQDANVIIWVFTKMIPTDWPLCVAPCTQTPCCLSGSSANDDERTFLRRYIESLRQSATIRNFANRIYFHRHILVTNQPHAKFKSVAELNVSLTSHSDVYFATLHQNSINQLFGNSFKIILNDSLADKWPEILNDTTFYGTQAGGDINWKWAICTTYTPTHPVILLRIFDLSTDLEGVLMKSFLQRCNDSWTLDSFTRWALDQREEIVHE